MSRLHKTFEFFVRTIEGLEYSLFGWWLSTCGDLVRLASACGSLESDPKCDQLIRRPSSIMELRLSAIAWVNPLC